MKIPLPRPLAPITLGAFFLALGLNSCRKQEAVDWPGPELNSAATTAEAGPTRPGPEAKPSAAEKNPDESSGATRFIAYNVENWLTMYRKTGHERRQEITKPDEEKAAIVSILSRHKPDVLGICEIGTEADLEDLQKRLSAAGLKLPHRYHTGGGDDVRHLALLSRFPITGTVPHPNLTYRLQGRGFEMGRGILDATVETPAGPVRFLGTHLKSKREVPEADQEMMRRAEAHLLRGEIEAILRQDPHTALLVYGDMNDTRQSSTLRILQGPRTGPLSMKMARLEDSRGTTWTHFWSYQDVYSRFDYVLFSSPMTDRFIWDRCAVLDDPDIAEASDHRPLRVEFR